MPTQDFEDMNMDVSLVENKKNVKSLNRRRLYYPSNNQEMYIVNAITGVKYPFKVGTFDSLRLFSVVDTLTNCDNKGYQIKKTDNDVELGNPNTLYYDSPEQYMQHRKVNLDSKLVEDWYNKRNSLFSDADGPFNQEAYERLQKEKYTKMENEFKERQSYDTEQIKNNRLGITTLQPSFYILYVDEEWHEVVKK